MKEYTLEDCLEQQKKVDASIKHNGEYNPRWAALAEVVEMIEHQGLIKTWSKNEISEKQAFMELIDIQAFCMSGYLMHLFGGFDGLEVEVKSNYMLISYSEYIDRLIDLIQSGSYLRAMDIIATICVKEFKRPVSDIYYYYMGKQTLTQFRQSNGYKEGNYQKIWGGREDNEFLTDALEKKIEIDDIPEYLEISYNAAIRVV